MIGAAGTWPLPDILRSGQCGSPPIRRWIPLVDRVGTATKRARQGRVRRRFAIAEEAGIGIGAVVEQHPRHRDGLHLARLPLEAGADANDACALGHVGGNLADDAHLELLFEFGLGRGSGGPWRMRLGRAQPSGSVYAVAQGHRPDLTLSSQTLHDRVVAALTPGATRLHPPIACTQSATPSVKCAWSWRAVVNPAMNVVEVCPGLLGRKKPLATAQS